MARLLRIKIKRITKIRYTMKKEQLRIGNLVKHKSLGVVSVSGILDNGVYVRTNQYTEKYIPSLESLSPILIDEDWLLELGFKKKVETVDEFTETNYELETKNVYFNCADDFSIAISDTKDSFQNTFTYITPDKELSNQVHLLQNLIFSLIGEELTIKE